MFYSNRYFAISIDATWYKPCYYGTAPRMIVAGPLYIRWGKFG